jgi:hypothetical protein
MCTILTEDFLILIPNGTSCVTAQKYEKTFTFN